MLFFVKKAELIIRSDKTKNILKGMMKMADRKKRNEFIYRGNECWEEDILKGLVKTKMDSTEYYRYWYEPESLYESLRQTQERFPDRICLVDDDGRSYTYSQFKEFVDRFSRILYYIYHVRQGQQVGILLYNSLAFCMSIYALSRLRAVSVPFSTKYREPEIKSLIEKSDIKGLIFHRDYAGWMKDLLGNLFCICINMDEICRLSHMPEIPELKAEAGDGAVLMFTSGTTSQSKGVLLKNFNIMHGIEVYQRIFHISERDITILPVPAYHVTGLFALLGLFIYAGGCVRLHKFFNAERVLKEMEKERITFIHASPAVYSMLLEKREKYPKMPDMRIMACGSGNMPGQKLEEIRQWIPQVQFRTVYGLTETSSPATIFPVNAAESPHIGSSGRPIPGLEFKICDDCGESLAPYETGTVLVRGTTVIEEYYKQTTGAINSEHWLDTGDIGYFDRDGYLYITDRKKDMINRGGEKICSYDVENILYEIPGIREAAVVGIPDERYGEVPAAMIVLEDENCPGEEEIRAYLQKKLAKFQIPVRFICRENLPMTPNLKIDKKEIRKILAEDKEVNKK